MESELGGIAAMAATWVMGGSPGGGPAAGC